jgi:hypothetical protein
VLEIFTIFVRRVEGGVRKIFFVHQPWYFMAAAVATLGSTLVFHGSVPQYHPGTMI